MLLDATGRLVTPAKPADVEYTLTADDIRRLTQMEAICQKFGLQLVCPKCTALFGPGHDGVEGKNDPQAPGGSGIELRCGCTRRMYKP